MSCTYKSVLSNSCTGFGKLYFFPVFVPYGEELGDTIISTGDDAAVKFTLQEPFPFFTKKYPALYVSGFLLIVY